MPFYVYAVVLGGVDATMKRKPEAHENLYCTCILACVYAQNFESTKLFSEPNPPTKKNPTKNISIAFI